MQLYKHIHEGVFLRRPNRFIAEVEIDGRVESCHVKNTGRCMELLIPGAKIYMNKSDNPTRSTKYDLISVWKGDRLINMDSQAPNLVFGDYLRQGCFIKDITLVKPEATHGNSRFDFYVEASSRKAFIEVKGVTLERNSIAMFPDAPTERGVKHLNELAHCISAGYEAYVIFIVQMQGISHFTPNYKTHQEFGDALSAAMNVGVKAAAFDCTVIADAMTINNCIPILL